MGAAEKLAEGRKFGDGVEFELREYWGSHESWYGGLKSNFGALLQALNGGGRSTSGDSDHFVDVMDKGTAGTRRTWRKLKTMADRGQSVELTILYRLYGDVLRHPVHNAIDKANGILADMTETAERIREDLAASRGEVAEEEIRRHTMRVVRKSESVFWERAPELQAAEEKLAAMRSRLINIGVQMNEEQEADKRAELRARRDRLRKRIERANDKLEPLREEVWQAMDLVDSDDKRPVYMAMSYADKTTSTTEALDLRIMHPGKDGKEERDALVELLRIECKVLETRARNAFLAAGK
jgi:hypothetical protein